MRRFLLSSLGVFLLLAGCSQRPGSGVGPVEGGEDVSLTRIPGLTATLGQGFRSASESLTGKECVRLPEMGINSAIRKFNTPTTVESGGLIRNPEASQLRASLGFSERPLNFRWLGKQALVTDFIAQALAGTAVTSFVRTQSYEAETFRFEVPPRERPADSECGDTYVASLKTGAYLSVVLRVEFNNESEKSFFEKDFGVGAPFASEFSDGSKDERMENYLKGRGKVLVRVAQLGGDPDRTETTLGYVTNNPASRITPIRQARRLSEALFASFSNQLLRYPKSSRDRNGWEVIDFSVRPYLQE